VNDQLWHVYLRASLVPRMQFYAVEIARYVGHDSDVQCHLPNLGRNRKGLNDWIYEKNQPKK
jgi:hypothetical protein